MKQMEFKETELNLLLLMKIADLISNSVSTRQIHSLALTLSQLTEHPKARDVYQKLSIYGSNDIEELNKYTLHYFRFPINCNVLSVSIGNAIEELISNLNQPDFINYEEKNLGTLLRAYCIAVSSKEKFNGLELSIFSKQIINVFKEVEKKLELCSDLPDPSLVKDLIGLVISILKTFSGTH